MITGNACDLEKIVRKFGWTKMQRLEVVEHFMNCECLTIEDELGNEIELSWSKLTDVEKDGLIDWVIYYYTHDETNLSYGCICDTAMRHKDKILATDSDYSKYDFADDLIEEWL